MSFHKKITEAKQQNDEYIRLLSADDEAAYMERIAIERLGYAYPNERRFISLTLIEDQRLYKIKIREENNYTCSLKSEKIYEG